MYMSVMPLAGELYFNQGGGFAHHISACPPGFENLTASLHVPILFFKFYSNKILRSSKLRHFRIKMSFKVV